MYERKQDNQVFYVLGSPSGIYSRKAARRSGWRYRNDSIFHAAARGGPGTLLVQLLQHLMQRRVPVTEAAGGISTRGP